MNKGDMKRKVMRLMDDMGEKEIDLMYQFAAGIAERRRGR